MLKSGIGSFVSKMLLLAMTVTLAAAIAIAQSSAGGGTIQGTVKDATGALVAAPLAVGIAPQSLYFANPRRRTCRMP